MPASLTPTASAEPTTRHKSVFTFGYSRSPDQDAARPVRHRVIVVGAGPVGLSMAIDLAQRGFSVVILDDADRIGEGSRGLCYAKRTLEVWDRLGCSAPMVEKGVTWKLGRCYLGEDLIYMFDLLPEAHHKMPAFINLQQYYVEKFLVERVRELPAIEMRWRNKVIGLAQHGDHATVTIETPEGPYTLAADWIVAADGARSTIRGLLGLDFAGEMFQDQFLIADVKMKADYPVERRFWFDPKFHAGQSALLHKQPDDVWRIDLQLSPEADAEHERQPDVVVPRIEKMLGHRNFDLEWVSVYRFQCRRIARFVHDRVLFVGDAAHQVSPFGARGANSGVQDAENLAWKLALVMRGEAPRTLLDSYDLERTQAADENIGHSTRSTDFIAPRTATERHFRDAALDLARSTAIGKRMVNSGRLSTASHYDSPLSTPDADTWAGTAHLGAPLPDAPIADRTGTRRWLLERLDGARFALLHAPGAGPPPEVDGIDTIVIGRDVSDPEGIVAQRLDATPGACWLVRPDQHLAARWRQPDARAIATAVARATGRMAA